MLRLGANDYNWALRGVSQNGTVESIKRFEKLTMTHKPTNYDWALAGACLGNNIDAVKYYLDKEIDDINSAFRITCEQGNLEIFKLLFEKHKDKLDFSLGLAATCYGARNCKGEYPYYIFDQLLDNFGGENIDCALYEASWFGVGEVVHYILSFADEFGIKVNKVHGLRGATLGGHKVLIREFLNHENIRVGYYEAVYSGNKDVIEWYENSYNVEDDQAYLTGLCQSGRKPTDFDKKRFNSETECLWCKCKHA